MRYNRYDNDKRFEKRRSKQMKKMGIKLNWPDGRFRKQHPLDCGKPGCMICNSTKILDIKTHKQEIEDLRFKEQLD